MSLKRKQTNDLPNSESEPLSNESNEEKSEEFLNFESFTKAMLSIPPKEAEEIRKRTPYPKKPN